MAFAHHEARPDHVRIRPVLESLAKRFGETAHYAVLDGAEVVYRAKVDPPQRRGRLTSTVGGRNPAHSTAVGKLLLSNRLPTRRPWRPGSAPPRLERRTAHPDARPSAAPRAASSPASAATPSTTRRTRPASTASPSRSTSPRPPSLRCDQRQRAHLPHAARVAWSRPSTTSASAWVRAAKRPVSDRTGDGPLFSTPPGNTRSRR